MASEDAVTSPASGPNYPETKGGNSRDTMDSVDDRSKNAETDQGRVALRKDIGFIRGVSYVVGVMIGSGIFVFPQSTMERTGSVGMCLIVWTAGGIVNFIGALCYAELSMIVKKSGGEYAFLYECYGPLFGYILAWTGNLISSPSSNAIGSLTFAEYFMSVLGFCGTPQLPHKLVAILFLLTLGLINGHSTSLSAPFQIIGTVTKLSAIVVIIIAGFVRMAQGHTTTLSTGFEGTVTSAGVLAMSFYGVNYAYGGWETINNIFEEVKNPKRNVVLCSAGGVFLVIIAYVMANVSYLTVFTTEELQNTPAIASVWAERVLGRASLIIPICVLVSIFSAINGGLFSVSRGVYTAARDGVFPEFLSYVNVKRYTPLPAILMQVIITSIIIIVGDVPDILDFMSFFSAILQTLVFLALIIFRLKRKDGDWPLKVPLILPGLMILYRMFLVLLPVILSPSIMFLYATLLALSGLIFYFPLVHFKLNVPLLGSIMTYLQLFLEVSPTTYKSD